MVRQDERDFTRVYIDDIVFSEDWTQHCDHYHNGSSKAARDGKVTKCQWEMGSFEFLGHVVGKW